MKLEAGRFLGDAMRVRNCRGLSITLSRYSGDVHHPWHAHELPTFFLLSTGEHVDHLRHRDLKQEPMTLIFHPAGAMHATSVGVAGMQGLNIEFTPEWLGSQGIGLDEITTPKVLSSARWRLSALRFLTTAFNESDDDIETQVLDFIAPVVKRSWPNEKVRSPEWLKHAESFIRTNYRSAISLNAIAEQAGVHPVYLARVFRRRYNCSVSEYIRSLRLAEAGRLVLLEGVTIGKASQEVGFADQAHFSNVFYRELGFRPKNMFAARKFVLCR